MKFCYYAVALFFTLSACYTEDDYEPITIDPIFSIDIEQHIPVDIIYIVPSKKTSNTLYQIDPKKYISHLNGSYFHRNGISLSLISTKTLHNNELFDLTDNRNNETSVFLKATQSTYRKDRLNIYIIKRSNTVAVAGIGKDRRVLITDEHLYTSTSPHEIGHALNLHHTDIEGNVMSTTNPHLRKQFTHHQIQTIKSSIEVIIASDE